MISRLKAEVARLKAELALATGGADRPTERLTPEELLQCKQLAQQFIASDNPEATITVGDIRKVDACFRFLKEMVLSGGRGSQQRSSTPQRTAPAPTPASVDPGEVASLKELLRQRDNEITILVSRLQKRRSLVIPQADLPSRPTSRSSTRHQEALEDAAALGLGSEANERQHVTLEEFRETYAVSSARFEICQRPLSLFVCPSQGTETLRHNKQKLKLLYGEAKSLGAAVNQSRANINALKAEIQRSRLEAGITQVLLLCWFTVSALTRAHLDTAHQLQLTDSSGVPVLDDVDHVLRQDLEVEKSRLLGKHLRAALLRANFLRRSHTDTRGSWANLRH